LNYAFTIAENLANKLSSFSEIEKRVLISICCHAHIERLIQLHPEFNKELIAYEEENFMRLIDGESGVNK
jgi:hypothetical protein